MVAEVKRADQVSLRPRSLFTRGSSGEMFIMPATERKPTLEMSHNCPQGRAVRALVAAEKLAGALDSRSKVDVRAP